MTKLPPLTGEQIIKALNKAGFQVVKQKGSHKYFKNSDNRATVVPVHKGEIVSSGLFKKMIYDAELSREEFLDLL